MKKLLSILVIVLMLCSSVFVFSGCESEEEEKSSSSSSKKSTEVKHEKIVPKLDKTPVDYKNKDIYYFKINGTKYTITNKMKDLDVEGFNIDKSAMNRELDKNEYLINGGRLRNSKDRVVFCVTPVNVTDKTVKASEATIGEFETDNLYDENLEGTVEVCNGITIGTAMSDVEAIFGKPTSTYDGGTYIKYTYQVDMYRYYEFEFNSETKLVKRIEWRYFDFKK